MSQLTRHSLALHMLSHLLHYLLNFGLFSHRLLQIRLTFRRSPSTTFFGIAEARFFTVWRRYTSRLPLPFYRPIWMWAWLTLPKWVSCQIWLLFFNQHKHTSTTVIHWKVGILASPLSWSLKSSKVTKISWVFLWFSLIHSNMCLPCTGYEKNGDLGRKSTFSTPLYSRPPPLNMLVIEFCNGL